MEVAGAQRVMLSQARWFHAHGYPVQVAFFYDKQGLQPQWQAENPFPVVSFKAWKHGAFILFNALRLIPGLLRLYRFLRKEKFPVIITFTPHSNVLGLLVAWLAGVPYRVATHHGYIEASTLALARIHGWLVNAGMASVLVAVSSQVRNYAIEREKVRGAKIVVIENGIEPLERQSLAAAERKALRAQIGIRPDQVLLLTVGRLTIQKGHTVLLDAIAELAPRYPQAVFAFAGDGLQRAKLEQKAMQLAIMDRVRFLGVRRDVDQLLLAADIFVQPSLWEGLSLAMLEALLAGLPVLATRVEGVMDVIVDGRDGLLVPPGDPTALAFALEKLLTDKDLRTRLAKQGKRRAETDYSIDSMCKNYERLLHSLVEAGTA
jgi:glycosyltransferase involved in cell wall biosynthesis